MSTFIQEGTPGRLPPAQAAPCLAATGKRTQRHPQDGTESKLIYKKRKKKKKGKERKEQRKETFTENSEQKKGAKMRRKDPWARRTSGYGAWSPAASRGGEEELEWGALWGQSQAALHPGLVLTWGGNP